MRVTVVVNPLAGGRRPGELDRRSLDALVASVAASAGASAEVYISDRAGGGRLGALAALDAGSDLIVAWGGDGTVNEVASVVAGTGVSLGLVPAGSGNGLARELAIPREPSHALRLALEHRTRTIDVGVFGDRAFVNVAGLGFDARVARRFNEEKRSRGLARYVRISLSEILRYQPQHYEVRWDGGSFEGTALLIAIANSRQYGNGACVAPLAELDDGALDLVVVRPTTAAGALWRARKLYTGSLLRDAAVTFARVRHATIRSEAALWSHVDGEPLGAVTSVAVSVRPRDLIVCAGR